MNRHDSQRGWFAYELYNKMKKDKDIVLITCDLGYGQFDAIRDEFPDRFFNVGAAEQAGMGIAVGLAMMGKKPFIYSITTFLLYRPFETIRNYINHEQIPVRLVAGGRDDDYKHDGFSHHSFEASQVLEVFKNIKPWFPTDKQDIPWMVRRMVRDNIPAFISLRR